MPAVFESFAQYNTVYRTMEKDNNSKNEIRQSDRKIFLNLKKTNSVAKNFITMSKIQLDKNMATIQPPNVKPNMRQISSSFSHKRIISGNNTKQFVYSHLSKTYRNFYDPFAQRTKQRYDNLNKQKSSSITNLSSNQKIQKQQQVPVIDKPKISSKSTGLVKGYSVNSHPGSLNIINQDRICVITNLNKSVQRDSYISFFSIYDGNNGVGKAQYFRDHFHQVLIRDKQFHKDIQISIRKALMIIQNQFTNQCFQDKISTTAFLMLIIVHNQAYIASMGQNKMVSSYRLGASINNSLIQKNKKRPSFKSKIYGNISSGSTRVLLDVKKIDIQNLDFIVLGSEGLFQNFDEKYIGHKVWRQIMTKTSGNFHFALGETTTNIMSDVFQQISTKNVSIILIAFDNMQKCFDSDVTIELPYAITNEIQSKQQF